MNSRRRAPRVLCVWRAQGLRCFAAGARKAACEAGEPCARPLPLAPVPEGTFVADEWQLLLLLSVTFKKVAVKLD